MLSQGVPDGYNLEISQDKAIPGHPAGGHKPSLRATKLFETGFSANRMGSGGAGPIFMPTLRVSLASFSAQISAIIHPMNVAPKIKLKTRITHRFLFRLEKRN